jgi:hypothetical protein
VPKVTPNGKLGIVLPGKSPKVGIVVATIAFVPSGAQQWMWAAVSFVVKPLNDTSISIVAAVGSSTILATPVPDEVVGGTSFAPDKFPMKVMGSACVAGAKRITPAANPNKQEPEIRSSDSFMFASVAEELSTA